MKRIVILTLLAFLFATTNGQSYLSDLQINEKPLKKTHSELKIVINKKAGTVSITDLDSEGHTTIKYKIAYTSTITDEDGTLASYNLFNNDQYNVLKVRTYSHPFVQYEQGYDYMIILSKYQNGVRLFDLGMLCNKLPN